jgi:hypothetical protein
MKVSAADTFRMMKRSVQVMKRISSDISRLADLEELKFNLALQKFDQSQAQIAIAPGKNSVYMDFGVNDETEYSSD